MTLKTILTASVLLLAPTFAIAMGCSGYEHKEQTAMSCADGMVIDAATGTCVAQITS